MSDHDHDSKDNLIVGLVGKLFYLLVPVILIVMMGIVGAAFIGGSGYKDAREDLKEIRPKQKEKITKPELTEAEVASLMEKGRQSYAICAACHGGNGEGGPNNMAPPLVQSKLLLNHPDAALVAVHKGIVRADDTKWNGIMAGLPFDDETIAAILTYARASFGNEEHAISPEMSAKVRAKYADRATSFTREELESLSNQSQYE